MSANVVHHDFARRPALTLRDRRALHHVSTLPSAVEHERRLLKTEFWGGWMLGCLVGLGVGVACAAVYFALLVWWVPV